MQSPSPSGWRPTWRSPFPTKDYEPLYLANGTFGGMLDLSGVTMDLWSSGLAAPVGDGPRRRHHPVTALRTQAYLRTPAIPGVWVGATGIHTGDPRYTSDPSMPHLAQVYRNEQDLDLATGVATTRGVLALGTQAAVEAGLEPARLLPFTTRVLFLKDSPLAVFEIVAAPEAEILFVPESVPEERFVLDVTSVGIMRLGNALTCDLVLRQDISAPVVTSEAITWTAHPVGGSPYRVRVRAAGSATATTLHGRPGWLARGRLTVLVEILPDGVPADPLPPRDFPTLAAEQAARWARVWSASSVDLPAGEELWQERYRASLFQVAQSMGDGPTHPGGLSKPLTPYWRGCFHDTDTYFCRALCTAGLLSEARRHLDFRTSTLPQARAHAASHGRSGVMFPWQVEADGGGDACDVPINSAIIACEAWHQHGFHGDDTSLAQALDILDGVLDHLGDLLADGGGLTPGPIMTFSETMFSEDPTEVRVALRAVAEAWLAASARSERDDPRRAALAQRMLASLPLPLADDGSYVFAAGGDPAYLRCPSVTLGLFPLHHLAPDDRLEATFAKELARILLLFAWLPHQASIVAALCGRSAGPSGAAALLRQEEVFVKPWYAVDEWENRRTARAAVFVTAAGGFCLAIQHLLLAERALGEAELFRACPSAWRTCGFTDLRTRSGWIVSARMEDGAVIRLEARPAHTRCTPILRLRLPDGSERQFVAPLIVAPQSGKGQRP